MKTRVIPIFSLNRFVLPLLLSLKFVPGPYLMHRIAVIDYTCNIPVSEYSISTFNVGFVLVYTPFGLLNISFPNHELFFRPTEISNGFIQLRQNISDSGVKRFEKYITLC